MSSKAPWSDVFVSPLTLLMIILPIIVLITPPLPAPTVTVELGEDSDDLESLSLTSEPYSPKSIVTLINETAIENGNVWRMYFDKQNDVTSYTRYVNIPLRNATEIILGASFNVEIVPRTIGIFNDRGSNTTTVLDPQNTSLILKLQPELLWEGSFTNLVLRILTSIEIGGEKLQGIEITGFWLQAVFDSPVYPLTIDIQRTNGISLFSNPMMRNLRVLNLPDDIGIPILEFISNDSVYFGIFAPTQTNDTVMLPFGNYTLNFTWMGYELNSSIYLFEELNHLVWRVRSIRMDVRATSNVSGYGVDFRIDGLSAYLLSEEPSILVSPKGNRTIDIRFQGRTWGATTSVGRNQNITFIVNPNLIIIGPIAIPLIELIPFLCFLLVICAMLVGLMLGIVTLRKALPISLLVLSYIVPWVNYIDRAKPPYTILHEGYYNQVTLYPSSLLYSTTTPGNLLLIMHDRLYFFPVMLASIFLLIIAYAGISSDEIESNHQSTNGVFAISTFLLLCLQLSFFTHFSSLTASYGYTAVVPGIAPFIVLASLLVWCLIVLKKRQEAHAD